MPAHWQTLMCRGFGTQRHNHAKYIENVNQLMRERVCTVRAKSSITFHLHMCANNENQPPKPFAYI